MLVILLHLMHIKYLIIVQYQVPKQLIVYNVINADTEFSTQIIVILYMHMQIHIQIGFDNNIIKLCFCYT